MLVCYEYMCQMNFLRGCLNKQSYLCSWGNLDKVNILPDNIVWHGRVVGVLHGYLSKCAFYFFKNEGKLCDRVLK